LLDSARAVSQNAAEPLPLPRELHKRVQGPYVVEPGDVLLIQPLDLAAPLRLPGDQPVLPDGTIYLGPCGQVRVAGLTMDAVEAAVNAVIRSRIKEPVPVAVRLISRQSKVFYVLGEVNAPGAFPLTGRETVLDGILAAGGLSERASHQDIILSRPTPPDSCRIVLPVCYDAIVQLGDTTTNYQLAPGDRIFVATRYGHTGLFGWPAPKECPPCARPQYPCGIEAPCPALFAHKP
jgi:protein involved in polysaccharide export with SLBB domain